MRGGRRRGSGAFAVPLQLHEHGSNEERRAGDHERGGTSRSQGRRGVPWDMGGGVARWQADAGLSKNRFHWLLLVVNTEQII